MREIQTLISAVWKTRRAQYVSLAVIIFLGLVIRLLLSTHPGSVGDMGLNEGWMESAVKLGIARSFDEQIDGVPLPNHGPVEIALYAASGHVYRALVSSEFERFYPAYRVFTKLPSMLFDLFTVLVLFFWGGRFFGPAKGLGAALLYALHPAVFYDSAVWGQTDGVYTGLFFAAFALLSFDRWKLAGVLAALSCLHKPQAFIFLPLFVLASVGSWRKALTVGLSGAATAAACFVYFLWAGTAERMLNVYLHASDQSERLSMNAYNFWWAIVGTESWDRNSGDTLFFGWSHYDAGIALFLAFFLSAMTFAWLRRNRTKNGDAYFDAAAIIGYAFFLFFATIHERYLFPVVAFLIPFALRSRVNFALYVGVSLLYLANLMIVQPYGQWDRVFFAPFPGLSTAIAMSQVWLFFFVLWRILSSRGEIRVKPTGVLRRQTAQTKRNRSLRGSGPARKGR